MKASRTNSSRCCSAVTALNLQSIYRAYENPGETDQVFLHTVDAELRGDGGQQSH